jgi:hypothetical protein
MRTSVLSQLHQGFALLSLLTSGARAFAADLAAPGTEQAALVINHQEVGQEEFRWFMEQQRAGVVASFKVQHNLEYGPDYWTREVGGTTPKAALQKRTIERLIGEKVEQMLFQELGLVQDIHYAAFLEQLKTFNREREQAAKQGKVVYGPIRFTQLQFYGHWKATLRARATEKLAQTQWPATEECLKRFYDDNRAPFRAPASFTLEVMTIQASPKPAAGDRADSVQATARKILAQLKAGAALPGLLKDPGESAAVKVSSRRLEEINADRMSELFPDEEQLKAVLALAPGEAALLTDSETQARVIRCVGKVPGKDRPYEAVQRQVKERWLGQQYDRHLEDLAGKAQIRINQEVIDALLR